MLQPTGRAAARRITAYPPRERWVHDATAYDLRWRTPDRHARKVHSINNPPLTRWVCAAEPFVCRLHHHGPTSDEVGMRENVTRIPTNCFLAILQRFCLYSFLVVQRCRLAGGLQTGGQLFEPMPATRLFDEAVDRTLGFEARSRSSAG